MGLIAALLAAGILTGLIGALLGTGGGVILVPIMTLFLHIPIRAAVSASLVAVLARSAGVAAMLPPGRGADVPLALRLEMTAVAGALVGSFLSGVISTRALGLIFAGSVLAIAGYMAYRSLTAAEPATEALFRRDYHTTHWPLGMSLLFFAGVASGLLGVGGGFVQVPIMYSIMRVPLGIAVATSNFMAGITATASVFVYYGRGDVYPAVAIPTALGIFIGNLIGIRIMPHVRVRWLRWALIVLLGIIGVQMLLAYV